MPLCRHHQPEDHGECGPAAETSPGFPCEALDRREDALDRIGGPDVLPVLGREVVEGQKLSPVLDQLAHRPFVFDAVGLDEEIECRFGLFPRFGHPDVMKVGIGPVMQGFRHRTGDIGGLVHPAASLPGIGIDIPQGSPAASPALSSFQIGSGASPDPGAAEPVSRETFHNNSMDCPVRVSEQARVSVRGRRDGLCGFHLLSILFQSFRSGQSQMALIGFPNSLFVS